MSEEEARKEPETPEDVDEILEGLYGELLDVNQSLVMASRDQARGALTLKDTFLDQASRCEEIALFHVRRAQLVATTVGDILVNEFLSESEEDEEEDPDE